MIYRNFLSLILVVLFIVSPNNIGYAQKTPTTQGTNSTAALPNAGQIETIQEKMEKLRYSLGIPGMSLVVVKDGQIIFMKGFGYKDLEKKIPVTPDTQFAIGSATKAFTALSVLMSADDGKVNLDANPKKYLSYFKMKDSETDKNITMRDLMDHSSGLSRTDLAMLTGKLNRQELIQTVGEAEPMAKLREQFFYNNVMFAAAGEIAAIVNKTSYEKLIPQQIFNPLGMTNSTMTIPEFKKAGDISYGYEYNFDTKETRRLPFRSIDATNPAGSINSSARDMAKWITFVMNGGTIDGKRLISEKNFDEWTKVQIKVSPDGQMSYGLGWYILNWNKMKIIGHGGNIDGFTSLIAMIPEKKIGFVLLTNASNTPIELEPLEIVFKGLLGTTEPAKSNDSVIVSAEKEVGKYRFEQAGLDVDIQLKDGNLIAQMPGQPTVTLENIGGRKYKVKEQEGFYVTFKDDSLLFENGQGNFTFPKIVAKTPSPDDKQVKEDKPKIMPDELLSKAIESAGGESNMRKIKSRVTVAEIDAIHQGVKGTTVSYAKFPNKAATETTMMARGKTIGKGWDYFDGKNGEIIYSFIPVEKYTGTRLEDIKLNSDFYPLLNWKTNYKTVEIKGTEKVNGEDCFVVELVPEKGTKVIEFYSTSTFLLMKQRKIAVSGTSNSRESYTMTFSDYRDVDGIKLPFKTVTKTDGMGDIISIVKSVKHNITINDNLFSSRKIK